ncbi:MAG: hypothetical protein WC612_02705 [Bdellovibrionales bacterium]
MTINGRIFKRSVCAFALMCVLMIASGRVRAGDMPTAAGSPIAGISFDDRPLILPIQRNFQMAMLTASSEMGRSCGRMEAYGWRLGDAEQDRVNQIFDNTVDRMRAQGFNVASKTATTVSRDVTLFAADRADKHLIFMWSAGEIGLVMVLCETSAPLSPIASNLVKNAQEDQPASLPTLSPMSKAVDSTKTEGKRVSLSQTGKPLYENFSPVGSWAGDYTCSQGTTGATLRIASLKGDHFEGEFQFYPTAKNPYVPRGRYKVFGEYDRDSQRILVNPGAWIERPKDFYNTIMIGSFDPVNKTFSAYFQGITGCTSFEARGEHGAEAVSPSHEKAKASAATKAKSQAKPKVKKPVSVKKKKAEKAPATTGKSAVKEAPLDLKNDAVTVSPAPRASSIEPPAEGIKIPSP